jgi:hypothetical protein
MKETLADRLARIGDEAEAAEADQTDRPIPPHVKVSRPNLARSKVLQVRLNPEEFDALEAIAARRELPVSTIARAQLLKLIAEGHETTGDRVIDLVNAATHLQTLAKALLDRQGVTPK